MLLQRAAAAPLVANREARPIGGEVGLHGAFEGDLGTLGVSMDNGSMMRNMDALEGATPFDRKFIDMISHAGAIRMARAEPAKAGSSPRKIAGIVAGQAEEISQMNSRRKRWYGKASPAGGAEGLEGRVRAGRAHRPCPAARLADPCCRS